MGRAQPITSWCRHAGSPDLGSNTVGSGHRPRCSPDRGSRRGMACSRRVRIYAPRYVPVVKKSCKRTLRLIVVSRVRSSNIFCAPTSRRCRLQRLDVTDGRLHRSACTTESGPMARGNYCGIKIPHTIVPRSQTSSTLSRGQVRCRMPPASHLVCASATAKWFNLPWLLLIGFAVLIAAVAAAQHLRGLSSVQVFVEQHRGVARSAQGKRLPFPHGWVRSNFLICF